MYTLMQQLRSWRHSFWFGISERVRWSRGIHHETPARELPALSREQAERIAALRVRYQVQFEATMNASTGANNYEYLDMLDRAWSASGLLAVQGGVGVEIEGHLGSLSDALSHSSLAEANLAEQLCIAAGLHSIGRWGEAGCLRGLRLRPPLLSCWRHSAG
jgi:hypothetical protein